MQLISGLEDLSANPGKDGGGDHARAGGTFLTGVRIKKTAGSDIFAGVSFDQLIARQIGHLTRFPSLELTCDAVRKAGDCDSGYSCAYGYNLAWRSPTQPVPPEPNPRLVFERLFGEGPARQRLANLRRRQKEEQSILDFVLTDARAMEAEHERAGPAEAGSISEQRARHRAAHRADGTPAGGRPGGRTRRPASRPTSASTCS